MEQSKPYTMPTMACNGWQHASFSSVAEMVETASAPLPAANADNPAAALLAAGCHGGGVKWFGLAGGSPAVAKAMRHGHAPGVAAVQAMFDELPDTMRPPVSTMRRRSWRDAGDSVDMQRVYGGQLDRAFQRTTRQPGRAPRVVRLVVLLNANHKANALAVAWRGVAALALAQRLIGAGYGVEIVGAMCSTDSFPASQNKGMFLTVKLKAANAPVDVSTLSGVVTVMGFSRFIGYGCYLHSVDRAAPHMGYQKAPQYHGLIQPGEVAGFEVCESRDTAITFITETLAAIEATTGA